MHGSSQTIITQGNLLARLGRTGQLLGWIFLAVFCFLIGFFLDSVSMRGFVIGVFGILGGVVFILPYRWATSIFFLYLGIEGMAKLLSNYNPIVHVGCDIMVTGLAVRWFFSLLLRRAKFPAALPPLTYLFAFHFIWFLIEFANPTAVSLVASLAGAKIYVTMVLLFYFGYYLATSKDEVRRFMLMWMIVVAIQAVTSLYQAKVGPASVLALSPAYAGPLKKFEGKAFRPFGTSATPGAGAVFMFMVMPFFFFFIMQTRNWVIKSFAMLLVPVTLLAMLVCQIRSALLKAIIGTSIYLVGMFARSPGKVKVRALAVAVVIGGLLSVILPFFTTYLGGEREENKAAIDRTLTLFDLDKVKDAREGAWDRIVHYAYALPLGAGLSRTGAAGAKFQDQIAQDPEYNWVFFTDNFWAATISEVGVPGSVLLTLIVLTVIFRGYTSRSKIRDRELLGMNSVILGSICAIFFGFWGAEGILYNPEAAFFWFFAGVLLRLPDLETSDSNVL